MFDIEKQAKLAEREVIEGKSYDYALYYSDLIMSGLSEGMAREKAEQFEQKNKSEKSETFLQFYKKSLKQMIGEDAARRQAIIADEKFNEGHSEEASLYYAELIRNFVEQEELWMK